MGTGYKISKLLKTVKFYIKKNFFSFNFNIILIFNINSNIKMMMVAYRI